MFIKLWSIIYNSDLLNKSFFFLYNSKQSDNGGPITVIIQAHIWKFLPITDYNQLAFFFLIITCKFFCKNKTFHFKNRKTAAKIEITWTISLVIFLLAVRTSITILYHHYVIFLLLHVTLLIQSKNKYFPEAVNIYKAIRGQNLGWLLTKPMHSWPWIMSKSIHLHNCLLLGLEN